jgi:hypothetical protein
LKSARPNGLGSAPLGVGREIVVQVSRGTAGTAEGAAVGRGVVGAVDGVPTGGDDVAGGTFDPQAATITAPIRDATTRFRTAHPILLAFVGG